MILEPLGWRHCDLISAETSRVLARVQQYEEGEPWFVWVHGRGFGEFMDLNAAKQQAEANRIRE